MARPAEAIPVFRTENQYNPLCPVISEALTIKPSNPGIWISFKETEARARMFGFYLLHWGHLEKSVICPGICISIKVLVPAF